MNRRILYLAAERGLTLNQSGGAGTHMRGTIKGFKENGYDVLAIIGGDGLHQDDIGTSVVSKRLTNTKSIRSQIKTFLPDKVRLLLRDIRTMWINYRFARRTMDRIVSFKPDAIYERASYLSMYGVRLARKLRIPHFYETDGCMVEIIDKDYGVFSRYIGNLFEKTKVQRADCVVVMNSLTIPEVRAKFGIKNKQIIVKSLGVSINDFSSDEIERDRLKEKLGIENKFVVGFVGAISIYHGVNYLIEASKLLNETHSENIVILIVGWSKEGERLKRWVDDNGLANVLFVGRVDKSEVGNYYDMIHLGVIPDCEETMYPIKILEYGIFNISPLVPKYPVFGDVLLEGETGYFFEPKNPHSMYESIVRIFNERNLCISSGRKWGEYVANNFQWKDTVGQVIEVLNGRLK